MNTSIDNRLVDEAADGYVDWREECLASVIRRVGERVEDALTTDVSEEHHRLAA